MKVEIGGGPEPCYRTPDWVQFDAADWSQRTGCRYVLGDMRELPFQNDSVTELYASNVLEHVSFLETRRTLQEWRRVLHPQGTLTVVVPDLLGIWRDYVDGVNTWPQFVERVYGSQTYDLNLHRAGFTLEEFPRVLADAGLSVVSCVSSHGGGGVHAVARKGA